MEKIEGKELQTNAFILSHHLKPLFYRESIERPERSAWCTVYYVRLY